MMCHARYPETPNAPILGVPSSICKEVDYVRKVGCRLYAHVDIEMFCRSEMTTVR